VQTFIYDTVIKKVTVIDGSGAHGFLADVAILADKIAKIGEISPQSARLVINGQGLVLAPGFIDVHTHDDLEVVRNPQMLAKVSQGITTVIVGNCGISASPCFLETEPVDPINLLGKKSEFCYPSLVDYQTLIKQKPPAVNVVALVGHTSLRAQVMDDLSREANAQEIVQMRALLKTALSQGAKGLSTGLAYKNAKASTFEEVVALAEELSMFNAIYTTHLRTEFDGVIEALDEAFDVGKKAQTSVVISHLKCAGKNNWGRSDEIIHHVKSAQTYQAISCDCYPYHASSSTLDVHQVTDDFEIFITWSEAAPEMAERTLKNIATQWKVSLLEAAERLMPAGAVYHGMSEQDVEKFIQFPSSMIGSDGLPCDPHPHPRLWGSFPRVLAHFCRDKKLLSLEQAIHKMTGLSATNFGLSNRGFIKAGYYADLVLFNADTVADKASFNKPFEPSVGIEMLWVNGQLTYRASNRQNSSQVHDENNFQNSEEALALAGQFLKHES